MLDSMKIYRKSSKLKKKRIDVKKVRKISKYVYNKLVFIFCMIVLALFFLSFKIYDIQSNNSVNYSQKVLSQQRYDSRDIPFRRGEILDRNGNLLATSNKVYNLIIDPSQINMDVENYLEPTLDALNEIFSYDKEELRALITEKADSKYIRYAKGLSYEQKTAFEEKKQQVKKDNQANKLKQRITGIWFEEAYSRVYPNNKLACNVIGFSSAEDTVGIGGIEQYYNDKLTGNNGREYGYLNDDSNLERVIKSPTNGLSLVSTIDVNIQQMVEKRIQEWESEMGSKISACIVMDPNNGEILAMASSRDFDLNNPRDLSKYYNNFEINNMSEEKKTEALNNIWLNFAISSTYEPGSPSKIFTVATAMEEGVIDGHESYYCDGYQVIGQRKIHCANKEGHGMLTVEEAIIQSCNDAMMQIVFATGKDKFSKFQQLFGFGKKTGIDLPGEADTSKLIHTSETMRADDLATNSFGQNYNCTMIEMASAFASVINGGMYYKPHVVKEIRTLQGEVIDSIEPILVRETVSPSTTEFLNNAMFKTVEKGTGFPAKVEGYDVGGKTGTSEKYPRGSGKYILSFIGFAPIEHPEVLCYVVVDEPNTEDQAHSYFASRLFKNIMSDVLPYMNVYTSAEVKAEKEQRKTQESVQSSEDSSKVYETDEYVKPDAGTFEEEITAPNNNAEIETSSGESDIRSTADETRSSESVQSTKTNKEESSSVQSTKTNKEESSSAKSTKTSKENSSSTQNTKASKESTSASKSTKASSSVQSTGN